MTTNQNTKNNTSLHIEGNLISGDYLADLITGSVKGQAPKDFDLSRTDKLADEIAMVWGEAKRLWANFRQIRSELEASSPGVSETRKFWVVPLLEYLGYQPVYKGEAEIVDGQTFAISHRAGIPLSQNSPSSPSPLSQKGRGGERERERERSEATPPIHITGCHIRLDQKPPSGTPRLSAHSLVQEYLNRTEHLWGIVTNGLQWRLLRNSSLMTRLTYIEFDLEQILEGENFAEFGLFYRLFHRSRLPLGTEDAHECLLEFYHQETLQQGGRVRDRLRDGVERAIVQLGNGFLQHPKNQALRNALTPEEGAGKITDRDFYRQILLLIYRLLFLMVAESRNLLLTGEDSEKARIYEEYYSIERLRKLAERAITPRREGFQDLWQGLRVTFALFNENGQGKLLGLSPLNGDLFGANTLPELNTSALDNYDLLVAIRYLSLYAPTDRAQLRRVNYAALDVEELGSVYESLLDFHPQVSLPTPLPMGEGRNWEFFLVAGSDRKSTGAYYTPSELVAQLVKNALEPVIAEKLNEAKNAFATLPNNQNSLTPQPPLPEGEGEQERWEISDSLRKKMQEVAREFRKNPTPSEAILWEAIRNRKLENRKFRRQHPIGTFIVDFFCQEEKLIVEVDGPIHESQQQLDRQRQELLETLGLRFVRVSSEQVTNQLSKTLETIKKSFLPSSPQGRGAGGEGFNRPEETIKKSFLPSSPQGKGAGGEGLNPQGQSGGEGFNHSEETIKKSFLPSSPQGRGAGGEGLNPQGQSRGEGLDRPERESQRDALRQLQEAALLSIKVCDPACGSGHFLLAAARRIGEELARVRTGELTPSPEPLRIAIRDVIQHCIYGVDINPLAVDLCKVALWIEGFAKGMPLNFLDHRIKCGNSLVGVLDLDVLKEGIPDEAFKAVTGDDKALSSQLKKANKKARSTDLKGQLSLLENLDNDLSEIASAWQELDQIPENTPEFVKQKKERYEANQRDRKWWRSRSACNLWTAAFFMPLTEENLQLLPTTAALARFLNENIAPLSPLEEKAGGEGLPAIGVSDIVDAANQLASEKGFFHWALEFPDVFDSSPRPEGEGQGVRAGFDCILGNPPWERIKLQEKEFFASKDIEIVKAKNKAEREKLIKTLPERKPELAKEFENAKHDAEAQSKFIRESNRFPLTAVGDINTYAVFSETARDLIAGNGRAGIIVPTGIATDDTCKKFFGDLTQTKNLVSLYDFENREKLFADVDSRMKFSLLGMSKSQIKAASFAFFLTHPRQVEQPHRVFQLAPSDIALMNPNTLTCPVFRVGKDAEITKKIYQNVPVLENERTGVNPWGISFVRMFDMANDSGLFFSTPHPPLPEDKKEQEQTQNRKTGVRVPLYEAKMFHQFNHRWATYESPTETRNVRPEEITDPNYTVTPRYWVDKAEVENRLANKWDRKWLIVFRHICRSTDERTAIFSLLPRVAVNDKAPILLNSRKVELIPCLFANFNSLVFDFVARQKVGGTSFSFFIVKQLPVLPPDRYSQNDINYIIPRVLELTYTAWDIKPFADDLWDSLLTPLPRSPKEGEGEKENFLHPSPSGRGAGGEGASILTQASNKQQLKFALDIEITGKQQLELTTPPDPTPQTHLRQLILEQWQANQDSCRTPLPPWERGRGEGLNPDGEQEGIPLPPFIWHEERRAQIRAELDAYYAKLYGLTRDELRYILDPADIYGADFPSETFRVLKNNEIKKYGEYRTQRLVLEAWDKLGY